MREHDTGDTRRWTLQGQDVHVTRATQECLLFQEASRAHVDSGASFLFHKKRVAVSNRSSRRLKPKSTSRRSASRWSFRQKKSTLSHPGLTMSRLHRSQSLRLSSRRIVCNNNKWATELPLVPEKSVSKWMTCHRGFSRIVFVSLKKLLRHHRQLLFTHLPAHDSWRR